jgi:hypothetical protein
MRGPFMDTLNDVAFGGRSGEKGDGEERGRGGGERGRREGDQKGN